MLFLHKVAFEILCFVVCFFWVMIQMEPGALSDGEALDVGKGQSQESGCWSTGLGHQCGGGASLRGLCFLHPVWIVVIFPVMEQSGE